MLLSEITYGAQPPIDGFGPGFFRVGGAVHRGALMLDPAGPRPWQGWDELDFNDIDLLLIGCGAAVAPVPVAFEAGLESEGVAFEALTTPAACRAYNMLLAESRRVGLAAFPL